MFKKVAFASAAFAQGKTYLIQTGEQGYSEAVDKGPLDFAGEGWTAGSVSGEFDADTMHSWKNGSVESILIFVKKQAE